MDHLGVILGGVQGGFYLLTGIWPLLHMRSFLFVTGPKTDLWLVRTVGLLIVAISVPLLMAAARKTISMELICLGFLSAVFLAGIDLYYVLRKRISKVYLLDAFPELCLASGWLICLVKDFKQ
jgi:hypothetical protein